MKIWKVLVVSGLLAVVVGTLLILGGGALEPPAPAGTETPQNVPAKPQPATKAAVDSPTLPVESALARASEPAPEQSAPPGIPRPDEWTEKTLAGTTWEGEAFDFAFGKDGTWHMAGRPASKWRVEGDRIKLFDDEGEVHYLDIVGDELMFQGKPVGIPVARD